LGVSDSVAVIKEFISEHSSQPVQSEELEQSRNLIEDEVLDSLGVMLLVDFLSERFSIEFEPDEIHTGNFQTVESIASLVDQKLTSKG
jgi:methoxymalonate biosynthesis acyl carrier protein